MTHHRDCPAIAVDISDMGACECAFRRNPVAMDNPEYVANLQALTDDELAGRLEAETAYTCGGELPDAVFRVAAQRLRERTKHQ